jgi:hypothetical protein
MTIYELIFILLFLGSLAGLLLSALLWRTTTSRKILISLATVCSIYLLILVVSDIFSSQKVFNPGEDECFDEMCVAVVGNQTIPAQALDPSSGTAARKFTAVTIRISNHSLGRAESEGGLRGRLYEGGAYINVSDFAQKAYDAHHGERVSLTQKISSGESTFSVLVFEVPQQMLHPSLTFDHGFTPGYFVIGESPFFHKPDIHQLPQDR